MARVVIRRSGTVTVAAGKIADVVAVAAVGAIVNRMHDGIGVNDQKMRVYSRAYLAELMRKGEDTKVDHRRSGLMLSQVRELSRTADASGEVVTLRIGVGTAGDRNLIAAYLQKLRRWFGLSVSDRKIVKAAIAKARGMLAKKAGTATKVVGR